MKNRIGYRLGVQACGLRIVRRLTITMLLLFGTTQTAIAYNPIVLPRDASGWTVFTSSADSHIMYVSSGGNDATGQSYSPSNPALGADPFNPTGTLNAFATYSAARQQARDGYPDWILFKRGQTFLANIEARTGRSDTEFALVGAYGPSGAMPVIHPTSATSVPLNIIHSFQRFAVMGLDFYHHLRDPNSGAYAGTGGSYGMFLYCGSGETIRQVMIEGCKFRFFLSNNIINNGGTMEDISFRRNVILDDYSSGSEHSHGLYGERFNGLLFEENILDHNGWYSKTGIGQPSQFHHNTYFSTVHNVTYKENIIMRASSGQTKLVTPDAAGCTAITFENNLWIDGEAALSIGYNNTSPALRFQNIVIKDNIVSDVDRDNPTGRGLGWGFIVQAVDTGTVSGNLLMNWHNAAVTNTFAMRFGQGLANVRIEDNTVYDMNPGNSDDNFVLLILHDYGYLKSGNTVRNNRFQELSDPLRMIYFESANDIGGFSFIDNAYYAFSEIFTVNVTNYSLFQWRTQTGDTSSFASVTFPDPTRSVEGYMTHMGGQGTIDAFIEACRNQGRYSWDSRLGASNVNSWLRAGFGLAGSSASGVQAPSGLRLK